MKIGLKLIKLQEEIHNSEGWRISSKIRTLQKSYYTFSKNHDELYELLVLFENEFDVAINIMKQDNREEFEVFLSEITRLLHNYLAAAKTLIDHTRKFYQDEYQNSDFDKEYKQKIEETFIKSPIAKFVQDLRNFSMHRTLPVAGATVRFDSKTGFTHTVNLLVNDLKSWDNWTKQAREFLDEKEERFSLLKIIEEYTDKVNEFQEWFRSRQIEIHEEALEHLEYIQLKYNKLYEELEEL